MLQSAPETSLLRLRKAELVRLWKVAGLWHEDDEGADEAQFTRTMGKVDLVDGLIRAVSQLLMVVSMRSV